MPSPLSIDQIISDLNAVASAEKTASAAPVATPPASEKVAQAKTDLLAALKRAEEASTKTAAAKEVPVAGELEKIAGDLAAADQEALVKEAQFYGAAVADGFMARLKQYEGAAENLSTKTASEDETVKIAEEAVRGYIETQHAIKVAAEQEFQRGYAEGAEVIEKIASDVFGQGMQDCQELLASFAK